MAEIDRKRTRRYAVIASNAVFINDPVAEEVHVVQRMALDCGAQRPQCIRKECVVVAEDDVVLSPRMGDQIIAIGGFPDVDRLSVESDVRSDKIRPNGTSNSV